MNTTVSEEYAASIFTVEISGIKIQVAVKQVARNVVNQIRG
jgi:ribosomal protein L25 (general stress protein Ctc)